MTLDPYHLALGDSTRLKLRASAMAAESGVTYETAVLFHEAARAEARALAALASPSAETRLRSAIERCGCLVEGRDPSAVFEIAWPEVLAIADEVPADLARALCARVDPMVEAFKGEFRAAVQASPDFATRKPGTYSAKTGRQLDQLLRLFPGDARFWTMQALRVGFRDPRAVDYARRAKALLLDETFTDGTESIAPAIEVLAVAFTSPLLEAEASFDAGYARVRFAAPGPDYCVALATAGLVLVERRKDGDERLWERIADIAARGAALPDGRTRSYEPLFRAVRMIAKESLANRTPSVDILYRVGLGTVASRSRSADPLAILREEMAGRVLGAAA